jgi:hypothetical protein
MKKTLIALSSALAIASVTGCGYLPRPIYAKSNADGAWYSCEICETLDGERYSVLSRGSDPLNRELRISGNARHMNASRTGDLIAINLDYEMVFVDTATFKVTHRWPYPSDRTAGILLSDDNKTLAMYYTNIGDDWLHVVTLWDVSSGKPIRKLAMVIWRSPPMDDSWPFQPTGSQAATKKGVPDPIVHVCIHPAA